MTTLELPDPTVKVDLPGGPDRMRQLILYVAQKLADAPHFGVLKLNKVLWRADFRSFAARAVPVTGREYRRLEFGPAPREMPALQRDMLARGLIRLDRTVAEDGKVEQRTVPLAMPDLTLFDADDLAFVDDSIRYYHPMTGAETSDDSHGAAWKSRNNGDPMPYELAYLSDAPLGRKQFLRLQSRTDDEGWTSL